MNMKQEAVNPRGSDQQTAALGALSGIRVIDVTHHYAGPYCTMMLGDLGADIIKIEPPGTGDPTRSAGSVSLGGQATRFMSRNRNKKSVQINLRSPRGQALVHRLCATADVFVENFRPGTADRLQVGFDRLSAINPRLIYCSVSAFGAKGPFRDLPGVDLVVQAMGGLMSITGEPGRPPVSAGAPVADHLAGTVAALGVLAALQARERTGRGQLVEVAMYDAMISLLATRFEQYFATGKELGPLGSMHPQLYPWQAFQAQDEPFVVAVASQEQWVRFCQAIARLDLAEHPAYCGPFERLQHRDELEAILTAWFVQQPRAYWLSRLPAAGVPSGPIMSLKQVAESEQAAVNGMFQAVEHASAGPIKLTASPVKLSATPAAIRMPPPVLGSHTAEVLGALGCTPAELAKLAAEGCIVL